MPTPESIFSIEYFKKKPNAFYKWASHLDLNNYEATPTHYFIKLLQQRGILWKNMTQNIDNLEEKTGIDMDYVV